MKRAHTHMKVVEKEMAAMKEGGKTNREIAEHFGFEDKYVVKRWVSRYNRRKKLVEAGIQPGRRGRPPNLYIHTTQGVLYLSIIRDLFDNSIVAYKTAMRQTVQLVLDTARMAQKSRVVRDSNTLRRHILT